MIIYGINPVVLALRAGRVQRIRVAARDDKRVDEIVALARDRGIRVDRVEAQILEHAARGGVHQGVVAELEPGRDYSIAEIVAAAAPDAPLLVVLDGVEDPHNIGAVLRSVDAAGAHGVVRQA
ncbi:MAG: TrmH family RNA methyltransferase, partial [Gemmatimonadales bacterium]